MLRNGAHDLHVENAKLNSEDIWDMARGVHNVKLVECHIDCPLDAFWEAGSITEELEIINCSGHVLKCTKNCLPSTTCKLKRARFVGDFPNGGKSFPKQAKIVFEKINLSLYDTFFLPIKLMIILTNLFFLNSSKCSKTGITVTKSFSM